MEKSWLGSILDENSFDRYYVEYKGYLFNHLAQGIVALHRLGADNAYIKGFVTWYTERLEGKGGPTHQSQKLNGEETVQNLRGKRKNYYRTLSHYEGLLEEHHGSLTELIRTEFPKLIDGMAGPALHGLIQLGYGVAVPNSKMVCEGLACLHNSYLPLVTGTSNVSSHVTTFGKGTHDILDVVQMVQKDGELRRFMLSESQSDWVKRLKIGEFGSHLLPLITMRGDTLLRYVDEVRLPNTIDLSTLESVRTKDLTQWLLDVAIILYHIAEKRNDFFLLHGVTTCWALQQALDLIKDSTVSTMAVRVQLALLLTVYLAQGSPNLKKEFLSEPDVSGLSWADINARILGMSIGTDEHIYKLVQVCHDTSQRNTDKNMADVYKRACLTAMEYDLY